VSKGICRRVRAIAINNQKWIKWPFST